MIWTPKKLFSSCGITLIVLLVLLELSNSQDITFPDDEVDEIETEVRASCRRSQYGCCWDQVTIARGPNDEGCPPRRLVGGCAGTRHGCCRDNVTAARGPNKEGCPETRLVGGCAGTRYGCCADMLTAATGHNKEGCPETRNRLGLIGGCAGTRYGCCADGVTSAGGENKLGCPEGEKAGFDQAWCSLPPKKGPCDKFTAKYYYDPSYGVCRQFWYGSCEGNPNRFDTEEECQLQCINVTLPGACRLPNVTGPCKSAKPRYFFNHQRNRCESFSYGGCAGNTNNFMSMNECTTKCLQGDQPEELRARPAATGCASMPCQNGFSCQDHSNGSYSCSCNPDWGDNCEGPPGYWCFSDRECGSGLECRRERECRNGECQIYARCTATSEYTLCTPRSCPSDKDCVGDRRMGRGFFCTDKVTYQRPQAVVLGCSLSKYGCCSDQVTPAAGPRQEGCCKVSRFGCCPDGVTPADADRRNCDDQVEASGYGVPCEQTVHGCCDDGVTIRGIAGCPQDTVDSERRRTARPPVFVNEVVPVSDTSSNPSAGGSVSACRAPKISGLCGESWQQRYRYDTDKMECEFFWWGDCGRPDNVFATREECEVQCARSGPVVAVPDNNSGNDFESVCDMSPEQGPCYDNEIRFYYNNQERRCLRFRYGGCQGNENNFETQAECERTCMEAVPVSPIRRPTLAPPVVTARPTVRPTARQRESVELSLKGMSEINEGEMLKITCTASGPSRVYLEWFINGSPVTSENPKYQLTSRDTRTVDGYQQIGELIVERAREEDSGTYYCRAGKEFSRLIVTVRPRTDRVPVTARPTPRPTARPTARPTRTEPPVDDVSISMQASSTVEAGSQLTVTCRARGSRRPRRIIWYFNRSYVETNNNEHGFVISNRGDPRDRQTLISELTAQVATTNHTGTYYCRAQPGGGTERMSIRVMDQPVSVVRPTVGEIGGESTDARIVCLLEEDKGMCNVFSERYFYDKKMGACRTFVYGGCGGNSNNFGSYEECESMCSERIVCSAPKETGRCRAAIPRFYFDRPSGSCEEFIYGGCDGNLNNFETKEACERRCAYYLRRGVDEVIPENGGGTNGREVTEDVCSLVPDKGDCEDYQVRWYYSSARTQCERFVYTGCRGNGNRFETRDECETKCLQETRPRPRPTERPTQRPTARPEPSTPARQVVASNCAAPKTREYCADSWQQRYRYDSEKMACEFYWWGGCEPSNNVFMSREECQAECEGRGVVTDPPATEAPRQTCYNSRYGCCEDGVTYATDWRKSNCRENNVITQPDNRDDTTVVMLQPGDTTLLECARGRNGEVVWYRDSFKLEGRTRHILIHGNGSLELRRVREDMSGAYACRVSHSNDIPHFQRYKVEVNVPLAMIPGPALVSVKPGDQAYLYCQATGSPDPRFSWSRGGRVIQSDRRQRVFGNGTLIISDVSERDVGDYVCTAENGVATPVTREVMLKIKESIEANILSHQGIYTEGEDIRMICVGSGFPVPVIEWKKQGATLVDSDKVTVDGGQLTIRSVDIQDAGLYTCRASNDRSFAEDVTTIQIQFPNPQTQCEDTMRKTKCHLIVSGKLCGFRIFGLRCCASCRRAGQL